WFASLFNVRIDEMFYSYKLLSLPVAFLAVLGLAIQFDTPLWLKYPMAIAIGAGFWGQFVVDTDANSQLNSIPIALLLLFALTQFALGKRTKIFTRERIFLAVVIAAGINFYQEFMLLFILAFFLYYLFFDTKQEGHQTLRRRIWPLFSHVYTFYFVF